MADLVTVTIDEQTIQVPKGTLVVEAAKKAGIVIPVFCYHPKLIPVGACRMCLVEIGLPRRGPDGQVQRTPDGTPVIAFMPKPQPACTTPVADGMVVKTNTPTVRKLQQGVLEFLLINHPLDCPVCDKGGECPLQDQTFRFGPGTTRFAPEDKIHFIKPVDLSPLITLDRERCILCFRCVRFQHEVAGDPELGVFQRGAVSIIDVAPGQQFSSNFSGNTIELCPVGALTSKEFRFRARSWEMQNVPSVCPLCSVGCNLTLQVRDNEVLRILARENEAVNEVWLCDRGRFHYEYLNDSHRLIHPQARQGDRLSEVSWPVAIRAVADALGGYAKTFGPQSVGGIIAPRLLNEDIYLFAKLFRAVLGSNNVDYRVSRRPLESRHLSMPIADIENVRGIFILGSDIFDEVPVLALRVRKAVVHKGARLVLAHPERVKLTNEATHYLGYTPGQSLPLVQGMIRVVLDENLVTPELAETPQLATIREAAAGWGLSAAAEAAGVSADRIMAAVRLLAATSPVMIIHGAHLLAEPHGLETAAALEMLATLLGTKVHGIVLEANAVGAQDMGAVPSLLPGGRLVSDPAARAAVAQAWGVSSLPEAPGLSGYEMMQAAAEGQLKALWLVGVDPLAVANGDLALVEKALTRVGFLIVQDMTETGVLGAADVVLPGFSFAEAKGTFTNIERRVQYLHPALLPRHEMRPDWAIVQDVAMTLGAPWSYKNPSEVMAEISVVVPDYARVSMTTGSPIGVRV